MMIQSCDSVLCNYVATRNQLPQNFSDYKARLKDSPTFFRCPASSKQRWHYCRWPRDDSKEAISSSVRGSVPLFISDKVCLRHSLGLLPPRSCIKFEMSLQRFRLWMSTGCVNQSSKDLTSICPLTALPVRPLRRLSLWLRYKLFVVVSSTYIIAIRWV